MISHETAWIDTALNFNISDDWYHTDADDPANPRASDAVTLYAQRPKTHTSKEEPKAAHSSGRHGSAFSVIKRMVARTERLRDHVAQELKSNTLSKPERAKLEAALRNPVIYLGKRTWGIRTRSRILGYFRVIKKHATQDLGLHKSKSMKSRPSLGRIQEMLKCCLNMSKMATSSKLKSWLVTNL